MKKIIQNLRENWITYGFETLVVIVGILGAFALNNWNEGRKQKALEYSTLDEIRTSIQRDTAQLTMLIRRAGNRIEACQHVISYFEERPAYQPEMARQFAKAYQSFIEFPVDLTGFNSLNERGTDLIADKRLRHSIINFYTQEYEDMRMIFARFMEIRLIESESLYGHFTYWRNEEGNFIMIPDSYDEVLENKFIKDAYYHLLNLTEGQESWLIEHKEKCEHLLSLLNKELDS